MSTVKENQDQSGQGLTQSRYHWGVTGSNLERTKNVNRRVVLETIRIRGPLERAAIVSQTNLAVQTVSNIVNDLLRDGLIKKCPAEPGRLGSPARPLDIEPDGALSIGLSMDRRTVIGCVANLVGRALATERVQIEDLNGPDAFVLICGLIERLRAAASEVRSPILGIGIAVSGPFGVRSYLMDGPTSAPTWFTDGFVDELSYTTGLPIELCSDSVATTIGQRIFGVARDVSSFAHLFIGYGTAVGYFLNDQVYCGTGGNAGEIGHAMLMPGGHTCFCGNQGCLEQYLSLYSVRQQLGIDVFGDEGLKYLCDCVANPKGKTQRWLEDAAEVFRRAVHTIEQLLDPDCIVVGGYMPSPVLKAIIAAAEPLYPSISQRGGNDGSRVILGSTGREVGVLSAASLPLYSHMGPRLDFEPKK